MNPERESWLYEAIKIIE